MVELGLKDLGYEYVVIDDCWALKTRDENGCLQADPEKFPHGMKAVADYIHSKGLKFGMYSCCGTLTCASYPSSFGHEFTDAKTFASWGVDFLKYDHCNKPHTAESALLYRKMGLALANCGRDILFSACSWGVNGTAEWIKSTGAHMWRSTGDIFDCWAKIKEIYDINVPLQTSNGHGCFNDMDMLIVGMNGKGHVGLGGCTKEEYRTHFSIWAMFGSPLMIGCDIRNMDEDTKEILMNKDVIAINQDAASRQPYGWGDMWIKHLDNGDIAVLAANMTEGDRLFRLYTEDIGIGIDSGKKLLVKDLWSGEEFESKNETIDCGKLPPHTCRFFRCKIVDR